MIVADSGIAAATLALALIYLSGHMQPWHVLSLMFLRAWAALPVAGHAGQHLADVPREQL
jgi:hypothetical protein